MNREEWLHAVTDGIRPLYTAAGVIIPDQLKISVGFPSKNALGSRVRRVGETWSIETAEDHIHQIFISPLLKDGREASRTLAHELIHAALPTGSGHKAPFKRACEKVGCTDGPAKSAEPGPELQAKIDRIMSELPPYPHAALTPLSRDKKQSTRMLKISCIGDSDNSPELHEEYVLRGSKKVIDLGLPICPICNSEMKSEDL